MNPTLAAAPPLSFALVGSPNSGKTTLFNALTGMRAKTGNYPGVTVDRREGRCRTPRGAVRIVDLPGTYSLHPISEDESVAVRILRGEMTGEMHPDGVIVVADATTLERSLPLVVEVLALGLPTLLVLTMVDELKARGGEIDLFTLKRELGVHIVGVVGHRGIGLDDLRIHLDAPQHWPRPEVLPEDSTETRFAWTDAALQTAMRAKPGDSRFTQRLDRILLHPVLGPLVFLLFVAFFFQSIFTWATPAMDFLDGLIREAAGWLRGVLPGGFLGPLLADGVVGGAGAVIVFLPQITILFAVLFVLEACGYMARAAFVIDRVMGWVGLEGRCFIALLSSYACAVPGIMATRTIPSKRDRLATILVAPFATCSARLPVYALLIAAFIPPDPLLGPLTWQGATLLLLYLLGGVSALCFAAVFKRGILRGGSLPFYQELPPYRFPAPGVIAVQVWRRIQMFLKRAGTVILAASIVIWALLNLPQHEPPPGATAAQRQQLVIESSFAADLGKTIQPVFAPLGFDWRVCVGLIGSFAAREVMVSTMAQVYGHGGSEEPDQRLVNRMRTSLTFPSALALLVFFVYALQCVSTIAIIRRETNSWRWPLFTLAYMTALAWAAAWITYRIAA